MPWTKTGSVPTSKPAPTATKPARCRSGPEAFLGMFTGEAMAIRASCMLLSKQAFRMSGDVNAMLSLDGIGPVWTHLTRVHGALFKVRGAGMGTAMTDAPNPPGGHLLVYQSDDGRVRLVVRLQKETVWLTQSDLARLFDCSVDNIALHIRNIIEENELDPNVTTEDSSGVRQEGQRQVRRTLTYYNLDVIISVGYRVKSTVATRFRIWATQRLRELIVMGLALDYEHQRSSGHVLHKPMDQPVKYIIYCREIIYDMSGDVRVAA